MARMTSIGHKKRSMMLPLVIDISKALLDVATYPATGKGPQVKQINNNKKGHKLLRKWFGTLLVKWIVFEATGACHRELERFLGEHALAFSKLNPRQARRFAEAPGKLAKTDRVDALMLARFGKLLEPPHSAIKSQTLEELVELVVAGALWSKTEQRPGTPCVHHCSSVRQSNA